MHDRNKEFRNYQDTSESVKRTYKQMQENQNLFFVQAMKEKYSSDEGYTTQSGEKQRKRFVDVFAELDKVIDESDPDTDLPQIFHAYQTGEALKALLQDDLTHLRKDISVKTLFSEDEWNRLPASYQQKFSVQLHELYPHIQDWSWLPLVGFIHDLGKVMATEDWGALEQWAVVGDTFPVGTPFSTANIFFENRFFSNNKDLNMENDKKRKCGIYEKNCGLDNLQMSWGHDEYMYSVLNRTVHHLPEEALYIVHFHSFYPWHTPRNGVRGYEALANEKDWLRLPLLKAFQQSDLYSKKAQLPDQEQLKSYYLGLLEKFVPGREPVPYNLRPAKILW